MPLHSEDMANQPTTRLNIKQIDKRDNRVCNRTSNTTKHQHFSNVNKLPYTALYGDSKTKKISNLKESRKVEFGEDDEEELFFSNVDERSSVNNRRKNKMISHRKSLVHYGVSKDSNQYNIYLKEQYIQANCQFVVSESVNCTAFLVDPDILVPWELVEQIRFFASEPPQCPICLYPPIVPRISKCGHIYCWACILQYIEHSSEEESACVRSRSKKCAICAEHIYAEDLRSLFLCLVQPIKVGDTLHLRLMRKTKGCTQVLANDDWQNIREESLPLYLTSANNIGTFSKILRASSADLLNMLIHEKDCLEALAAVEDLCASVHPFICQALNLLEARIVANAELSCATLSKKELEPNCRPQRVDVCGFNRQGIGSPPIGLDPPPPSLSGSALRRAKRTSASEESAYYFYQAADGQLIYLNSLNWRCLVEEAGGDTSRCPPFLCGTVLQLDAYTMSISQRKKHPYLNHLPLAATLWEAELDLKSPIISKETLSKFEKIISQRRVERRNRERLDRQHSRLAEEAQMRQAGLPVDSILLPSAMYQISLPAEVPTFTESDPHLGSSILTSGCLNTASASVPSFAEMLRNSKCSAVAPVWPVCKPPSQLCDKNNDYVDESLHVSPKEWNLGAMLDAQLRLSHQKRNNKNKKRGKIDSKNLQN